MLAFTQRAAARDIEKVLRSAVANAEANHGLIGDDLVVNAAFVDEGPTLKRWRARARGRVGADPQAHLPHHDRRSPRRDGTLRAPARRRGRSRSAAAPEGRAEEAEPAEASRRRRRSRSAKPKAAPPKTKAPQEETERD